MTAKTIEKFVEELKDLPDDKIESLFDYLHFLKTQSKIPNKETLQTFEDTDNGKNLIYCKDANDMFKKLGI